MKSINLLICSMVCFLISCNIIQVHTVKEPKYNIPITYNIGWWNYQNQISIDSFSVEIADSQLNLFNSISLIKFNIKGKLKIESKSWNPYVSSIHVSERIVNHNSLNRNTITDNQNTAYIDSIPQAIIEFTPIVEVEKSQNQQVGRMIDFDITNEYTLHSLRWGNNTFLIKCGNFEKILVLIQNK